MIDNDNQPTFKRGHLIVNPVSGQGGAPLEQIKSMLDASPIKWEMRTTEQANDSATFAQEACEADIDLLAVYGGDGTVMSVASGMVDTNIPLMILPGGTGNALANDLDIPIPLEQAFALIENESFEVRSIDAGRADGEFFLLRLSIGLEAELVLNTLQETKERFGWLAYVTSGVDAMQTAATVTYNLTLDGLTVKTEGVACMVCNSGNTGAINWRLLPDIDVSDGLLDVIVFKRVDVEAAVSLLSQSADIRFPFLQDERTLEHWQVKRATVHATPSQKVVGDGESLPQVFPITAEIIPNALRVIVPKVVEPEPFL